MKARRTYYRHFGAHQLIKALSASQRNRIVIGAWDRYDPGWIPTQRDFLNLLEPAQWKRYFTPDSIDALLAEHVWEHLSEEEGRRAAKTCFTYLRPGGYLRIAVPDGLCPDQAYVQAVKAGNSPDEGEGSPRVSAGNAADANGANHKALYTYKSLTDVFESAGFRVVLYEYFDEAGTFHCEEWDRKAGTIWRSKRFDPRNKVGKLLSLYPGSLDSYLCYCSIVLDAVKDGLPKSDAESTAQSGSIALLLGHIVSVMPEIIV
jgi:predicted SAM-dependent methyltransferase